MMVIVGLRLDNHPAQAILRLLWLSSKQRCIPAPADYNPEEYQKPTYGFINTQNRCR
jgi:hypothetical protein